MQKVNIFPTPIYEFHNSDIDNDDIVEKLSKETLREHTALSSLEDLHTKAGYEDLFLWFDECLDEIHREMRYDCDRIAITSSWCNKQYAQSGMFHAPHKHTMSMLSGVYYCTPGAPTCFQDPVTQRTEAQIEVLQHDFTPFEYIQAVPGKLIIFPSWMYHSTTRSIEEVDRWSIAFNTFPDGKINYNIARDSVVTLKVGPHAIND